MTVGKIYKEVARLRLEKNYPCMGGEEKEALINCGIIDELENFVNAKEYMEIGIFAICSNILPGDIMDIVLYDENPDDKLAESRKAIHELYPEETDRACLVLSAMKDIHNRWVSENTNKFLDENRQDKRFMFMPFWLIGFDEAMVDYDFIQPFLRELGIEPSLDVLKQEYKKEQKSFLGWECIHDEDSLKQYIVGMRYGALTFGAHIILQTNPTVVRHIVKQILRRSDLFSA